MIMIIPNIIITIVIVIVNTIIMMIVFLGHNHLKLWQGEVPSHQVLRAVQGDDNDYDDFNYDDDLIIVI